MRPGDVVYTVRGFNNQCYSGIFVHVFSTEEKMRKAVEELMAQDMNMTRDEFIDLMNTDEEAFDERFTDADRVYEECLADGEYYCDSGYKIAFGLERIK